MEGDWRTDNADTFERFRAIVAGRSWPLLKMPSVLPQPSLPVGVHFT